MKILFSLFGLVICSTVLYAQKNMYYSSEITEGQSINLEFYEDKTYALFFKEFPVPDEIIETGLSAGTVYKRKDTLVLKDCLYGFELCYLKKDSMLIPIKTYCSLMDRVLIFCSDCSRDKDISVSDWCVSKEANEYKDEIGKLRASVKASKLKPVINTGVYYNAVELPDGSFYSSYVNIPVLTLHADGTYEIESKKWNSLNWSKGFWEQKNRLLILQDECINYEEFLIITEDKKLLGYFSLYDFIGGGYFMNAKAVKKMNDWE